MKRKSEPSNKRRRHNDDDDGDGDGADANEKMDADLAFACQIKVNKRILSKKIYGLSMKKTKKENYVPDQALSSSCMQYPSMKPQTVTSSSYSKNIIKNIIKKETKKKERPTPEECEYVTASLSRLHPHVVTKNDDRRKTLLESCGMRDSITDAVVSTMLSQNTTDKNSKAAFANLKTEFFSNPNANGWELIANARDTSKLESAIKVAGLAKTRAERITAMLQTVQSERGTPSLEYLRSISSDEEVKKELGRFKGLGPKTISCVLLFALGRNEFPVDTHVLRITSKMTWLPVANMNREAAYDYLNEVIPDSLKMDLHCLLVAHGKHCHACASRGKPQFPPKDGSKLPCPLGKVSSWGGILPKEMLVNNGASILRTEETIKKEGNTNVKVENNEKTMKKEEEEISSDGENIVKAEEMPINFVKQEEC